ALGAGMSFGCQDGRKKDRRDRNSKATHAFSKPGLAASAVARARDPEAKQSQATRIAASDARTTRAHVKSKGPTVFALPAASSDLTVGSASTANTQRTGTRARLKMPASFDRTLFWFIAISR